MSTISLIAADGFQLSAYEAVPDEAAKGCIVVIQEVFGVNHHIREVCDGYAAEGYLVVAPAIFDRFQPGIELGYEQDDMMKGVGSRVVNCRWKTRYKKFRLRSIT